MKTLLDIIAGIGVLILVIAALNLCGCTDDCTPGEQRCHENAVELCTTDAIWEVEDDCSELVTFDLKVGGECCMDELGVECREECE